MLWFSGQFVELEELGYKGLSIHFKGDDVCITGTSAGEKAAALEVIEYIHAVIIAAIPPPLPVKSPLGNDQSASISSAIIPLATRPLIVESPSNLFIDTAADNYKIEVISYNNADIRENGSSSSLSTIVDVVMKVPPPTSLTIEDLSRYTEIPIVTEENFTNNSDVTLDNPTDESVNEDNSTNDSIVAIDNPTISVVSVGKPTNNLINVTEDNPATNDMVMTVTESNNPDNYPIIISSSPSKSSSNELMVA